MNEKGEISTGQTIDNIRLKMIDSIRIITNAQIRTIKLKYNEIIRSINIIVDLIIDEITKLLHCIGMRNNLLGFYCYVDGILYTLARDNVLEKNYMTCVYEKVKTKYNKNIWAIEREMRYAKDISWKYNSDVYIEKILGYPFNYKKDTPTNMELIIILTECLKIAINY